ncbi:MAG: hemolysin family protein [Steroidobacteraceae bacterium]|nr:hemolysin family protein [Steroidobacteraceae bacterium]
MIAAEVLLILLLVLLNGFFALAEMALVSAKRARLQAAAERGSRGARIALELLEDSTSFLSAVQVGITLIGILTGVYSGATFAEHLGADLAARGIPAEYAEEIGFAVVVLLVGMVSLVFGELVPKRIALTHAEGLAISVAPIMKVFARAMAPLVWLLRAVVDGVLKVLPVSSAPQASVTEDEVRAMVAEGTQTGVFLASERRLIEGVLALADRKVESIMVPRQDVLWLDLDEPLDALWQQAKQSGHARFLVAHGSLQELLGMITLANLSEALRRGRLEPERDIEPPLHVPVGISALQLLDQFQKSSSHLAVITDEYGGIEGVATPIDILRAIAGELPDLGTRERAEALRREDGSWLVDGHLSIEDLQQRLGRRDMTSRGGEYHTAAGFVLARLGRIPKAGDVLSWRDLRIEVVDMDGLRIDKVLVAPAGSPATPDPGA